MTACYKSACVFCASERVIRVALPELVSDQTHKENRKKVFFLGHTLVRTASCHKHQCCACRVYCCVRGSVRGEPLQEDEGGNMSQSWGKKFRVQSEVLPTRTHG